MFSVEEFLDLNECTHAPLFQGCTFIWQVLEKLDSYLKSLRLGDMNASKQEYAYLVNPDLISIGEGTVIEPGAYIKGPCVIGRNCHIRHTAYIRGDVIIGDNCVIGHATELKNAILCNHVNAAHFAYIGDSILGNHVNLGAGVKCANLRLNGAQIVVRDGNVSFATGMRKLGAIIGDGTQIGCNVVMNPGTIIGKDVHCHPSLNLSGCIPSKSIVRSDARVAITKPR